MAENFEEDDAQEVSGGATDFKAMGEKCRDECSRGADPEVDLPKEHPLWVIVGMLNALLAQTRKKDGGQQAGLAESQLKEISDSVTEAVQSMKREPKADRASWIVPAMLAAACLLCFGWGLKRPAPFSPEVELLARQMEKCNGPDVMLYADGMCGFKSRIENGRAVMRGWKVGN